MTKILNIEISPSNIFYYKPYVKSNISLNIYIYIYIYIYSYVKDKKNNLK